MIKEKFFKNKKPSATIQDNESEDDPNQKKQKLKGPIPINPSHS